MNRLMSETEVSENYGLNIRALQKWRCVGGGPRFVKLGRQVRYRASDVEDFIESHIRRSTSDEGKGILR